MSREENDERWEWAEEEVYRWSEDVVRKEYNEQYGCDQDDDGKDLYPPMEEMRKTLTEHLFFVNEGDPNDSDERYDYEKENPRD